MQSHRNPNCRSDRSGRASRRYRRTVHWPRTAVCVACMASLSGTAQNCQAPGGAFRPDKVGVVAPVNGPPDANSQAAMREQQVRKQQEYDAANEERKRQIDSDSAKLLKLATDLKADVDKTDKDTLPVSATRKAEEIERLAHDVKEKMKLASGWH
jgi:hypothetical protein